MATVYTLPASVFPWGPSGPEIPLPGNPAYVDGTDVSDPLLWLFTRTAFDGTTQTANVGPYTAFSGTSSSDRNTIRFPAGLTTWVENGLTLGLAQRDGRNMEYAPGYVWPNFEAHAWKHVIFDLNGGKWWQEDPTNFDDGVIVKHFNTTANSTTVVLTAPLQLVQVTRINDGLAAGENTTIQSENTDFSVSTNSRGTATSGSDTIHLATSLGGLVTDMATSVQSANGTLYPGGQYGTAIVSVTDDPALPQDGGGVRKIVTTADDTTRAATNEQLLFFNPNGKSFPGNKGAGIVAVAPDRVTLTTADPAYWTHTNTLGTVYLPQIRPERNVGVDVVRVDSAGSALVAGVLTERAGIAKDIKILSSNGIGRIVGSNPTGANGIDAKREGWQGVATSRIEGITIDNSILIEGTWSDPISFNVAAQIGLDDVDLQVEFPTISCNMRNVGRHGSILHGTVGLRWDRVASKNIERLAFDCETTSPTARWLDTEITNSVLAPGTAMLHIAAATLNGEPARPVDGLITTDGSDYITTSVANGDQMNADDVGAYIVHPNLPAHTYLLRRMSPTRFHVSAPATTAGTADGVLGSAVLIRDLTFDKVGAYAATVPEPNPSSANIAMDASCPPGRVYFTCDTVNGQPTMTNIVFEPRLDGQTFTAADMVAQANIKVFWGQAGVFPGGGDVPISAGATSLTFDTNAAKTVNASQNRTVTASVVAGSRTITWVSGVKFSQVTDKGHAITGPAGVLRAGTTHVRGTGVTCQMSRAAKVSGTYAFTVGGKMRGWANLDVTPEWSGIHVNELRVLSEAEWGGTGVVPNPVGQPCVMLPNRSDRNSITRNFIPGLLTGAGTTTRYLAGAFTAPGVTYTPAGTTISDNQGPGMVDDQAPNPTVTVALVLSVDDASSDEPVFTVVGTRSDAVSLDGQGIVITRDGSNLGSAIFDGDTAIFEPWYTSPIIDGLPHLFQCRWGNSKGGSWDTQGSLSNIVEVDVTHTPPAATSTVLVASPSSPQVQGVAITLTSTVSPDPSALPGTVTFRDGATVLGTSDVVAGVAVLVLPTGRPAGVHPFTATFNGNGGWLTSTSNTVTYTTTSPPVDASTTTVLSVVPSSPRPRGSTIAMEAEVTPHPPGGTVTFKDDAGVLRVVTIGTNQNEAGTITAGQAGKAVFLRAFNVVGTHSLSAVYSGTPGFLGSTSTAVPFVFEEPADTEGPVVIDCDPYDGQESVPLDQVVTITFDEVPAVTIEDVGGVGVVGGGAVFQVRTDDDQNIPISGTIDVVTYEDESDPLVDRQWTFTPSFPLDPRQGYVIVVSDWTDGTNPMSGQFVSRFDTGQDAEEYVPDGLLVAR